MKEMEVDVLIVGAGVTGLTLALLLADFKVSALAISKHRGTAPSPRAHITNQRTMEVFRDLGVEERVRKVSVPLPGLGNSVMATGLADLEIARYRCYGGGPHQLTDFQEASPCEMVNSPQHILEPVMLECARERGADVRFYNEMVFIEQTASGGVVARILQRETGEEYLVRARYVVGADGGRSTVAEQLGFGFRGQPELISMISAWIEVDLAEYTTHRPSSIYWMLQPGSAYWVGSGTLITVKPWNEWMLNWQYDPTDGEPDTSDAAVIERVRSVLGLPGLELKVKDVSRWQVNNIIATEYRRGNVFLAGDAAHRHPPSSGLGSNTCVQDAYNLAWKLALVLLGKAEDSLLDSYHQERQPVGQQIVEHAIQTLHNMIRVPEVLGFGRNQSKEDGYKSLHHLFSDSPEAKTRLGKLREAVNLQNKRSNALGLQLGHRYEHSGAVLADGPFPKRVRDPILYYEPTTHPGGYMPHAWVEYEKRLVSTLDIVGHGRFGLIVGAAGKAWIPAAAQVSQELGIDLPVYMIGARCPYDDVYGEWEARQEITRWGALLVRPDRHIAWRAHDKRAPSHEERLRFALKQILGHVAKTNGDAKLV
ncbi:2,4-dichlorophenol 6-monooxygenase [Aspergillus keveii]|uniref:2,4-dichlorophenol 6-monooxygenase n=1 Tax=Aspergillus keveii TaxID=714993 RepID=A0ABR4FK51_9EURO